MSDTASLNEQNAANYIQEYFLLSTGVEIPVVTETQFSTDKTDRFISVGYTTLADSRGITVDNYDLGFSGYAIKTLGGNVYLISGNSASIIGAAFGYLNEELGVEVYAQDCYSYTENDENYVLNVRNEVVIPDMDIRTTDITYATANGLHYEMGYVARAENIFGVSASAHQTLTYYAQPSIFNNPDDPENYHPKWFYDNTDVSLGVDGVEQVCFTAHGDEAELQAMKEQFLSVMINHRFGLKNGYGTTYIFGLEDNVYRCDCSSCSALKEKYGVDNAASIIFANSVAEMMKAWMETEEGLPYKKDFKILIDAYEYDIKAPAIYNEATGKYEPIDDLVICNENVEVFFAPAHMDFKRSIYDEANRETYEAFEGWKVCSPHGINLYLYQTNYRSPLFLYDTYTNMQELYQYFNTANIKFVHNSGNAYNSVTPGFEVVTTYIQSLLAKDVDTDVDAATQKFFDNYFGVASADMKEFFDSYLANCKYFDEQDLYPTYESGTYMWETVHRRFADQEWTGDQVRAYLGKLDTWYGYVNSALTAIAEAKAAGTIDEATYNTLYNRIVLERIPILYEAREMINSGYSATIGGMDAAGCLQTIKADCELLGITSNGALGSIADL